MFIAQSFGQNLKRKLAIQNLYQKHIVFFFQNTEKNLSKSQLTLSGAARGKSTSPCVSKAEEIPHNERP